MADITTIGDHVIPRSIIGTTLDGSGLLAQPPIIGVVNVSGGGSADVLSSEGKIASSLDVSDATDCPVLRVAAPADGSLYGKTVQLVGADPNFSGPVLEVLGIELDPSISPVVFTDCVVVRSRGPSQAYFVATAANVAIVD